MSCARCGCVTIFYALGCLRLPLCSFGLLVRLFHPLVNIFRSLAKSATQFWQVLRAKDKKRKAL